MILKYRFGDVFAGMRALLLLLLHSLLRHILPILPVDLGALKIFQIFL